MDAKLRDHWFKSPVGKPVTCNAARAMALVLKIQLPVML